MLIDFGYKPLETHKPFHQSTAYERLLIGGYGSGKSWALCAEAIAVGLEQPGSEILIMRKTIPALRDTTEAIFLGLLPDAFLAQCTIKRMGGHIESLTFPTGSKYMFRGLDNWMKLKSLSVAYLFYDEVDEVEQESYEGMMSRVRQREPTKLAKKLGYGPITKRGIASAANPAGENWVWQRFVGPNRAANTAWFKSTTLDNPTLAISYVESMLSYPAPWVRRYILCEFDEFGGSIYPEWNAETHIIKPYRNLQGKYEYEPDGFFIMGFDPGTHAKNAAVWCYHDRRRNAVVAVAEYAETGMAASEHARSWRKTEALHGMKVRRRISDPIITTRDRGSNMQLSDIYRRNGFNFEQGPRAIEQRLWPLGEMIANRRFLATTDCPQLAAQLGGYRYEDLTPVQREKGREPKPLKKEVDLVDAAQYVASRYIAPPKIVPTDDKAQHAHEIRDAIRKQLRDQKVLRNHDLGSIAV